MIFSLTVLSMVISQFFKDSKQIMGLLREKTHMPLGKSWCVSNQTFTVTTLKNSHSEMVIENSYKALT